MMGNLGGSYADSKLAQAQQAASRQQMHNQVSKWFKRDGLQKAIPFGKGWKHDEVKKKKIMLMAGNSSLTYLMDPNGTNPLTTVLAIV